MDIFKIIATMGISAFFLLLYFISDISDKKLDRKIKTLLGIHHRKVLIGLDVTDKKYKIMNDCYHSDVFFKMDNTGTYDISNINNLNFKSYATKNDFYLEGKQ